MKSAQRKPHIHVMAICHSHGPLGVEIVKDLDGLEKYIDSLVDLITKRAAEDEEEGKETTFKIHSRAKYSLEFHKMSDLDGMKHEFMVTYSYCSRIMKNCQLRWMLDKMDALDEEMDSPDLTSSGMVASIGNDGVVSIEMVGGDMKEIPPEIREVIEKIVGMLEESGIGKRGAPDMEKIMGEEQEAINKRFNDMFK